MTVFPLDWPGGGAKPSTCQASPLGRTATSRWALATSMPMVTGVDDRGTSSALTRPCVMRAPAALATVRAPTERGPKGIGPSHPNDELASPPVTIQGGGHHLRGARHSDGRAPPCPSSRTLPYGRPGPRAA